MSVDIARLQLEADSTQIRHATRDLKNLETQGDRVDRQMGSMTKTAARLGAALVAAFATHQVISQSLRAYSDLNRGLIAVQKTSDMTNQQMEQLESNIQDLALTVPVSTKALLDIAAAAGQLGVRGVKDITLFTETVAKLEMTTDIVGEEAAKSLVRLMNTAGEAVSKVGKLGSVIVALGNTMAASESEIVHMAGEIGRSVASYNVASEASVAYGAALKSMGARAEISGSAIGRSMIEIEKAILERGESFRYLQKVTQMTGEQIEKTFSKDATIVFNAWIKGMNRMVGEGESAVRLLEEFGMTGVEQVKGLTPLIKNVGLLEQAFETANKEIENATALNLEAMKASESFAAQMGMTLNAVNQIAASIGEGLAPAIIDVVGDFREWVEQNDEFIRQDLPTIIRSIASSVIWLTDKFSQATKALATDAKAFALLIEGQISLKQFLFSSVQEMQNLVAEFDNFNAAAAGMDFGTWQEKVEELTNQYKTLGMQIQWLEGLPNTEKEVENLRKQQKALEDQIQVLKDLRKPVEEAAEAIAKISEFGTGIGEGQFGDVPDPNPYKNTANEVNNLAKAFSFLNHEMYEKDYGNADNWKAEHERLESLKAEIGYMEDWINLVESGLTTQEATLEIERQKLAIRLENQDLNPTEIQHYIDLLNTTEQLTQAEKDRDKATEEFNREQEKARQEYEREWERVYDDMHKFAADTFYDIFDGQLDSFEDFADQMLNIFKRMLANMAAEAAMTNIFKPMMNQMAGSALGNMFGLPSVSGGGTTMFPSFSGMSNLPGMGWLGATIPGSTAIIGSELGWGAAAAQDIGVMASPGVTWGSALGAGALGSLGYSTLGSAIGLPTSGYSGITSGLGAAGMSAYGGSLAGLTGIGALGGPIGIGIGALAGGLLGGLFGGSDPTPTIQLKSGLRPDSGVYPGEVNSPAGFNYHTWLQDVGSRAEIGSAVTGYFDSLFIALDDATKFSVKDVLSSTSFLTRVDPNDYGGDMNAILAAMAEDIFGDLQESLEIALLGFDSSYIDLDFFEAIKVEGESLFNTFARFSSVVENTDNFMEEFNRRVDSLGQTPVEAYQQIQLVSGVLAEMDMAIAQITGSAVIGQINALSDTWNAYIDVMKQAQATAEQLTDAESKRNLVVGSQITGITTSSIAQALKSGSSVDAIVSKAMGDLVAEKMAQEMFDEMVPVVEEAGRIWSETGGNIDAVTDYLRSMGYQFEDTMSVFSDSMESARDALDAAIGKEEQLINARLDAADKIDTLLVDLMGGSQAPVQSMEFFERRYEQLLAEAQGATTAEEINSSVDALTGFVSQYLDFAGDYGGQDYNSLFNKITSDLKDIEYEQRSEAEKQISKLEEINSTLGIVADAALSLETAFSNFLSAQSEVVQAGYDEGLMPFADGGISTGPASGYPIMAHNTEAHVPIKNGSIPVEISRSGTIPNVNLKIFIGNKEIKDFQVEVINTDPEAQRAIRRVANG